MPTIATDDNRSKNIYRSDAVCDAPSGATPPTADATDSESRHRPHDETQWERLNLALNRLESAILAQQKKQLPIQAATTSALVETANMRVKHERDELKGVVESTLGELRAILQK